MTMQVEHYRRSVIQALDKYNMYFRLQNFVAMELVDEHSNLAARIRY